MRREEILLILFPPEGFRMQTQVPGLMLEAELIQVTALTLFMNG